MRIRRVPIQTPHGRFLPLQNRPGGREDEKGVLLPPAIPPVPTDDVQAGFRHPGSISTAMFAPGHLVAWWRLGESTTWPAAGGSDVSNWAADSSGNGLHLNAVALQGTFSALTLPTPHVVGGLDPGDAEDGAIKFNQYYRNNVGSQPHQWLNRADNAGFQENTNQDPGWTLACWVKYLGVGSSLDAPVITTYNRAFGGPDFGWTLSLDAATGKLAYLVGQTVEWRMPFGLAPDVWTHFAMVLEKDGATYNRLFYLNGSLIEELSGTATPATGGGGSAGLWIGGGNNLDAFTTLTAVGVDEAAIWTVPLTQAQVVDIYLARMLHDSDEWVSGTITPAEIDDNTLPGSKLIDGSVSGDKLMTNSIPSAAIEDAAITTAKIADAAVTEVKMSLSDVTTDDVTSTKHGFAPKAPADATKFMNGAATPAYALVKDSDLSTSDITTNDVSTSKHGFAPKLPNSAEKYLDGTGAYSKPTATQAVVWMPLADADGTLVLDSSSSIIPTLITL